MKYLVLLSLLVCLVGGCTDNSPKPDPPVEYSSGFDADGWVVINAAGECRRTGWNPHLYDTWLDSIKEAVGGRVEDRWGACSLAMITAELRENCPIGVQYDCGHLASLMHKAAAGDYAAIGELAVLEEKVGKPTLR